MPLLTATGDDNAETIFKAFPTKTINVDLESRIVRHYVTTDTVDEDLEVLLPTGADVSRFKKTGTVFDVHEYGSKNVIGRNVKWQRVDDGIIAETRFSPRPPTLPADAEWWPDSLLWLYYVGDISGWSIGFQIAEARPPTKKDTERFGETVRRVISKYRVLEYSCAPIPCNEDSLTLAVKGILSPRLANALKAGKRPEKVQTMFPTKDAEPIAVEEVTRYGKDTPDDDGPTDEPEMKACAECGKEYAVNDMVDDDGRMVCKACMDAKKSAPAKLVYYIDPAPVTPGIDLAQVAAKAAAKAAGKLYYI